MNRIAIVAARRSPQGRFLGALAERSAVELACAVGEAVLQNIDKERVDQVILGNVLGAGQGMNVARQVGVRLGLPVATPAFTVNMMCASGLQAVVLAAQAIRAGAARCVLCGGTESMSQAPYLLPRARTGYKFGNGELVDLIQRDGLIDTFSGQHMGTTAETLARTFEISRADQDAFALRSHQRAVASQQNGAFAAELVPIGEVTVDEHPRADTSSEKLARLKPAFAPQGTVTAGNASGMNDGAALLLLAEEELAHAQGWPILAFFEEGISCGCEPDLMGLGPVHAVQRLTSRLGCGLDAFDLIELNEAFAAQVLSCLKALSLPVDRVNVDGGAIALGHPLGTSGARLAVHLVQQLATGRGARGLATLCIGGGMGIAASFTTAQ